METIAGGFSSLKALQEEHQHLLPDPGSGAPTIADVATSTIKEFLDAAASSGRFIIDPRERRKAQEIIRFWTAELITRGVNDWALPALARPQLQSAEPKRESAADAKEQAPAGIADSDEELARSRAIVRISASARQWRESTDDGWLLQGDALREAERYVRDDDDIRALVDASRIAENQRSRRKIGILSALVIVLLVFAGAVTYLLIRAVENQREIEQTLGAEQEASDAKDDLNKQLQESLNDQAKEALERQDQLDSRMAALQDVAKLLHRLRDQGQVNADEIPTILRPLVAALDQPPSLAPVAVGQLMRGYDSGFLQTSLVRNRSQAGAIGTFTIPLPSLTAAGRETAYEGGRPLPSINFSVVLDTVRRMPVFSAVNLQRSKIVSVERPIGTFQLDPRVPEHAQLSPEAFAGTDLDRGRLVNARDIAWGDAFSDDPESAGRIAFGVTNVMTNVTPRYPAFNRGPWVGFERYAREQFSQTSDRIIIFSGPIFGADDPTIDEMRVPQQFWKVLIASDPSSPGRLIVEGYVVPQDGGSTPAPFSPEAYRTRLAAIERLAKLDFGEMVRAADIASPSTARLAMPATQTGKDLVALLVQAQGADAAARGSAMSQLMAAIRDLQRNESDLRPLADAIPSIAKSFASLGPDAQINMLTLLAAIPKTRWDSESWIDIKATARRALADAAAALGGCADTSQACILMAGLKPKLDWSLASGRTILVKFAGLRRNDVKATDGKLKMLGWDIAAEDRTALAAGFNEVRYPDNEDDRRAAEVLAADLRALGLSSVRATKASGPAKSLEVWLSI
jgi:DNA/RNA endonuclease G (NUC1)